MPTGIAGFDEIADGGLPRGGVTVVLGGTGTGKTIFGIQILARGARDREPGILVAFEESAQRIIANTTSFAWSEAFVSVAILDAQLPQSVENSGEFDLLGLLAVVGAKAKQTGARRVVFDGIDVLLAFLNDQSLIRRELFRLRDWVHETGISAIVTAKASGVESRAATGYEFLEFMADCVVTLDHRLQHGTAARFLRIVKYRGAAQSANELPFAITREGIEVASNTSSHLGYPVSNERISTGVDRLDAMLSGGYLRGSSVLITGVPGTAKTSLGAAFAEAAAARGERTVYVSFDEAPDQIVRNVASIGVQFRPLVDSGVLSLHSLRGRAESAEAQVARIRALIREHAPKNLVIDPLSAIAQREDGPTNNDAALQILDFAKTAGITLVSTSLLDTPAFARGEVDAVAAATSGSPVLLHTAQGQLRESRQLLRAIFDGAMDAIVLADDEGIYLDANPAACKLFGLPREQLLGRRLDDFAQPGFDGRAGFRELLSLGHMAGRFPLRRLDGTSATLDFSAVANVVPGQHLSVLRDITDRVAAEDALRRNEALFRAVIEKSSEIISLTTADGTTRFLTPSAWRLLGWAPEEMAGQTLRDQVIPEDRERIANELARLVLTGARDMAMEIRVAHRDGSIRWVESTGTNLLDDPDVRAIVGNYRDITESKRSEEALRESRNQLEEAQAIAHVGSWRSDVGAGDRIEWSRECYVIFGVPENTPITVASFFALIHPADRERVEHASRGAYERDAPYDLEHRVLRPDGRACWVHERAVIERDGAGTAIGMLGTVQDVTDRRAILEALRTSEEQYRRIVEATSEGVWSYDANSVTTFMNTRMAEMLGYRVGEAVGRPIFAFLDQSQCATAETQIVRRQPGTPERYDVQLRRKDGSKIWTSIQSSPIFGADGRSFDGGVVLVTDIALRRLADEARGRLAAIVESSDDAIVSVDVDGAIATWNRGAETLYQYRGADLIGHPVSVLFPPASHDQETSSSDRAAVGDTTQAYDTTHRRKDGSFVEVSVKFSPVRDITGAVIASAMVAKDLTATRQAEAIHRRTEEQFRQAQKMEAVGRLAGGVAHDFNNLLTVILSYSQFAIEDLKPGDPLRDDMMQIDQAGRRATELTRQLLAFSRQQMLQPRVLDINQILPPMERMLRRLLGEDVTLSLLPASALGRVVADEGQLEQVVMNLAVNARDAMPTGGNLTIETADVHFDREHVGGPSDMPPGDYVMFSVCDTGTGMDPATCARVFEPFFTTKELGKGTGLGLSTVFGIVRQSGGYLSVFSELGHGTTFKVYLPMTDRPADAKIEDGPPVVLRGSETVLLVEDEEQVRVVAAAILRRHGYNVLETSNGGEAFLVSKTFSARIHLLLTDVVMPRMSGRRLAEELTTQRPDMRVLYASGYTDDAIIHHGVLEAGVAFIQKPFTPDALLRKVREVIDASRASS